MLGNRNTNNANLVLVDAPDIIPAGNSTNYINVVGNHDTNSYTHVKNFFENWMKSLFHQNAHKDDAHKRLVAFWCNRIGLWAPATAGSTNEIVWPTPKRGILYQAHHVGFHSDEFRAYKPIGRLPNGLTFGLDKVAVKSTL